MVRVYVESVKDLIYPEEVSPHSKLCLDFGGAEGGWYLLHGFFDRVVLKCLLVASVDLSAKLGAALLHSLESETEGHQ